jgi:hypothetical protein
MRLLERQREWKLDRRLERLLLGRTGMRLLERQWLERLERRHPQHQAYRHLAKVSCN